MEGKKAMKKKRDVVVVGVKLRPSSRELLTWTLAKFTKPGDQVVALHITLQQESTSPSSVAQMRNVTHREVDSIFDSVIGVYDGFCSIKQIDLQLKVTSGGSSLRRTLIEEVKQYNAVRLILGTTGTQQPTNNSSFTLANHCCKHLPSTCSVLVIQHGRVVFEKAGALTSGDNSKGWKPISQQIMRDKTAGQNAPKQHLNARKKYEAQDHDAFSRNYWSQYPPKVSHLVLHPYKYVPPQVQGLGAGIIELEKLSPLPASGAPKAKHQVSISNKANSSTHSGDHCLGQKCYFVSGPMEDHPVQEKPVQHCTSSDSQQCLQKLTNTPTHKRGWPLVKTHWESAKSCSPNISLELKISRGASSACDETYQPSNEGVFQTSNDTKNGSKHRCTSSDIPQGWPLLRQSMAATKLENPHSKARRMSVVEWVLQLPERPKRLEEQHSGPMDHTTSICSAIEDGQVCGDVLNEEVNPQEVDIVCSTEAEKTLLEKCCLLCKSETCVVFEIADIETATNNFSKDNIIGRGGCSQVYRGVLSDGRVVAVKCLNISSASDSQNEFLTELEIVSRLRHCRVVELLGYCIDNNQQCLLVYKLAPEGNLEQKLHHSDEKDVLPWSIRYNIALGVGEALEYLHNSIQPVIHRDVKSSNILLQSDLSPQLTDFGLSKWAPTSSTFITCNDVVGTFGYLAPEYFMFGKVSDKTDIYSFGVVLLELVSGKHPIETARPQGNANLILWARPLLEDETRYGEIVDQRLGKEYDSDQLKYMLIAASLCLQHSPHSRPPISSILKVLQGEHVDLEFRQDSMCKNNDDGYMRPTNGDYDIRSHLTLALYGLDDDMSSQAGVDQNVCNSNPNKLIEEYLQRRYSRSNSFD